MGSLHWIASVVLGGGVVVALFDLWYKRENKIRADERGHINMGENLHEAVEEHEVRQR